MIGSAKNGLKHQKEKRSMDQFAGLDVSVKQTSADQQNGPQRCAQHRSDDAGGTLSPVPCEDATQSETTDAADPSQASAVEGDCNREPSTRYFTQLRPQGRNGRNDEV